MTMLIDAFDHRKRNFESSTLTKKNFLFTDELFESFFDIKK